MCFTLKPKEHNEVTTFFLLLTYMYILSELHDVDDFGDHDNDQEQNLTTYYTLF